MQKTRIAWTQTKRGITVHGCFACLGRRGHCYARKTNSLRMKLLSNSNGTRRKRNANPARSNWHKSERTATHFKMQSYQP